MGVGYIEMIDVKGLGEGVDEESMRLWTNLVVNPDPYNALNNVMASQFDAMRHGIDMTQGIAKNSLSIFAEFFHNASAIEKAKMVYIDESLLSTILNTDNDLFVRPMPLPCMFINQDFRFEDKLIKGILFIDTRFVRDSMSPDELKDADELNPNFIWDNINIYIMYVKDSDISLSNTCEEWMTMNLADCQVHTPIAKFVATIVVNVLDFMDNDDKSVEVNYIVSTREENDKRIKRGKFPTPNKVFIRPKPEFRNYYIQLNDRVKNLRHSKGWFVKGFWRHFRNPKYVNKIGTRIRIKAFVKGDEEYCKQMGYVLEEK
jgi:hypothetical protein